MTPLERAAEALKSEMGGSRLNGQWMIEGPFPERDFKQAVRAGLTAIREPSEAMVQAGSRALSARNVDAGLTDVHAAHYAMIDALLAEEG